MAAVFRFGCRLPRWRRLQLLLFLGIASLGCAQTGVRLTPHSSGALESAKIAVRRYCEMDAAGFRLSSDTAARMRAVSLTQELLDWQGLVVISNYQVESARVNSRGVLVTVSYRVVGRFENGDGFIAEPGTDTLELQAVSHGDEWKLSEDNEQRARVLKWLREQASAGNPEQKQNLEQAIRGLQ